MDLYITLFIVFLLGGLATLIKYFGCEAMIAGYNTASPSEQKYMAEKGIGAFAGNYLYLLAGVILAGYLIKKAGFVWGVDISWALFVVIIVVMIIQVQRFNPPASMSTQQSLRTKIIGLWAGGIITVAAAGLITWNALPAKFNLQANQLEITGAYGLNINYSDIEDIRLQTELPGVGMKTNGLNLGPILKGHFIVEGMGNARLFLRSYHEPVCIITLKDISNPVLINFSDTTETALLFQQLNSKLNDYITSTAEATDWEPTIYETINNFGGVTMTVKEGSVSSSSLTVVFENKSSGECIYGKYFCLEKKINGSWYQVPVVIDGHYGFDDIGYNLTSGDDSELPIDWEWLYGCLYPGDYRIVKDILDFRGTGDYDQYYLATEFTIR